MSMKPLEAYDIEEIARRVGIRYPECYDWLTGYYGDLPNRDQWLEAITHHQIARMITDRRPHVELFPYHLRPEDYETAPATTR